MDFTGLASAYAAMGNFAVVPDTSTANYKINSDGSQAARLRVNRFPFKFYFHQDGPGLPTFVQLNWVNQSFKSGFELTPDDTVVSYWKTRGATFTGGVEYPLTEVITLVPAMDVGVLKINKNADYLSPAGISYLQPIFANAVFDWDTKAWVLGGSLGLDYRTYFGSRPVAAHSSLAHNHIQSFSEATRFVEFSEGTTTLAIAAEMTFPTPYKFMGLPVAVVSHLANTSFWGGNRDVLGFDHFYEVGLFVELDVRDLGMTVRAWQLGFKAIISDDVDSWVLDLGYRFRLLAVCRFSRVGINRSEWCF